MSIPSDALPFAVKSSATRSCTGSTVWPLALRRDGAGAEGEDGRRGVGRGELLAPRARPAQSSGSLVSSARKDTAHGIRTGREPRGSATNAPPASPSSGAVARGDERHLGRGAGVERRGSPATAAKASSGAAPAVAREAEGDVELPGGEIPDRARVWVTCQPSRPARPKTSVTGSTASSEAAAAAGSTRPAPWTVTGTAAPSARSWRALPTSRLLSSAAVRPGRAWSERRGRGRDDRRGDARAGRGRVALAAVRARPRVGGREADARRDELRLHLAVEGHAAGGERGARGRRRGWRRAVRPRTRPTRRSPSARSSSTRSAASSGSATTGTAIVSSRSSEPGRGCRPPRARLRARGDRVRDRASGSLGPAGRGRRRDRPPARRPARRRSPRGPRRPRPLERRALRVGERRAGERGDGPVAPEGGAAERGELLVEDPLVAASRSGRVRRRRPPSASRARRRVSASDAPPGAPTVPKPRPARPSFPAGRDDERAELRARRRPRGPRGCPGRTRTARRPRRGRSRPRPRRRRRRRDRPRARARDQRVAVAELRVRAVGGPLPAEDADRKDRRAGRDAAQAGRPVRADEDPGHPRPVRSPRRVGSSGFGSAAARRSLSTRS